MLLWHTIIPEKKSNLVQRHLEREGSVQISALTEVEILSAFNKKVRVGNVSKTEADEAYNIFERQCQHRVFQVHELNSSVFKSAQSILQQTQLPLRTLDALHLGVAKKFKLSIFSFDHSMIEAAKEFNIPVIKP